MKTLRLLAFTAALSASWLTVVAAGQTRFNTLYKFGGSPDGAAPQGLVAGPHGALYGATAYGGTSGYGTVFQLTPPSAPGEAWTETVLYRFTNYTNNGDGANPFASPVVGANGELYGTTSAGGDGLGTVYELAPPAAPGGTWTETVLYTNYGELEQGYGLDRGVVVGAHGELYSVTSSGGFYDNGVVFKVTPPETAGAAWTMSIVYDFPDASDGKSPEGLSMGPGGVIYGTTSSGGSHGAGTVFALTPSASLPGVLVQSVLYSFTGGADGAAPSQPPVSTSGGILYGTTSGGGSAGRGTVFELTPPAESGGTWTETVLYSFGNTGDGKLPDSPLTVHGGAIYGTTLTGTGSGNAGGSVFELQQATPGGPWAEKALHNFAGQAGPYGGLVIDNSGALYGATTSSPGLDGAGTVYRVKP
jgi:uncharacterized repeat protein (TIGR03803 family)